MINVGPGSISAAKRSCKHADISANAKYKIDLFILNALRTRKRNTYSQLCQNKGNKEN